MPIDPSALPYETLRDRVREYYDGFRTYLDRDLERENPRHVRVLSALRELVRAGDAVLDLGCGIGITTRAIRAAGASAVGVDLSPKLIERARSLSDAEFRVADITELALERTFDVVTLIDALEHIAPSRYPALWQVLASHTRAGGRLYINYPDPDCMAELQATIPDKLQIIDESVPIAQVLEAARHAGFTLLHQERYALKPRERYVELVFERQGTVAAPRVPAVATRRVLGVWAGGVGGNYHFVEPLLARLAEHWEIRRHGWRPTDPPERLAAEIREVDACWFEWANGPVIPGSRLLRGKPAILRLHRYEAYGEWPAHIEWSALRSVYFVSEGVRRTFQRRHPGVLPSSLDVRIVPNAIDTSRFLPPVARARGARLLFLGRVSPEKNPALALQVLDRLRTIMPQASLTFVGRVQDAVLAEYLPQQVRALGLEKHVRFLGHVAAEQLPALLRSFDVLLNTSHVEGHPVSVIEGLAAGLRPVLHRFVDADHVFPAEWLFDRPEDAVARIVAQPYAPEQYQAIARAEFDLGAQAASVLAHLDALVARRRVAAA